MEQRFKQFTTLIASINRSIRRLKTEEMSKHGLKSIHALCIYYLYTESPLTVGELCDICEEDKANVSRAVDKLEEMGYIRSRTEASKRYKTPLVLTDEGRKVGESILNRIKTILVSSSKGILDSDRENMYMSLAKISENLSAICDECDA